VSFEATAGAVIDRVIVRVAQPVGPVLLAKFDYVQSP